MTFAQNCDMMEKTGRTRQGLPARFAIGYSQFIIRQYRIILSADTASEARQLLSQKRR